MRKQQQSDIAVSMILQIATRSSLANQKKKTNLLRPEGFVMNERCALNQILEMGSKDVQGT